MRELSRTSQGWKIVTISVFLVISLQGCASKEVSVSVAIREELYREEQMLPLSDQAVNDIVEFIASGGIHSDDGMMVNIDTKSLEQFLELFQDEQDLSLGNFMNLKEAEEFIEDLDQPVKDVFDAREREGPERGNRYAYAYNGFWFVFIIDNLKNPQTRRLIPLNDRKFSRIIVMRVLRKGVGTK